MNTKIMEGLVGAGTNMRQTDTTMRVFRDARRRGDLEVMERAMQYTGDFTQKAGEYQEKAQEGMEEEAQEVREKMKAQMEEAIQNRKEEQKEQEERLSEAKAKEPQADTLEVSKQGLALLAGNPGMQEPEANPGAPEQGADPGTPEAGTKPVPRDGVKASSGAKASPMKPVTYNSVGVAAPMGQGGGVGISV